MLKRNWKILFVGISQVVDILAMLASAGVVIWLKRYPHLGTQTANNLLLIGFIIFVVEDSAPEAHKCASFLAHQPFAETR